MSVAGDIASVRDLYRELVLDHARNPRHFGRIDGATHSAVGINPVCGDRLTLYVDVSDRHIIDRVRFEGTGCAISIASASLLTEAVTGLATGDADDVIRAITGRLDRNGGNATTKTDLGVLRALDGVREYPARVKCATLAWRALDAALRRSDTPATTEPGGA